jgi:hypothetical protein
VSYLGNYPEQSVGAGNQAVFGTSDLALVWAALAILLLSVVSYVMALALRLPTDRVAEHIGGVAPVQRR